jgi:amino acid adenylation domain-containing protein
MNSNPADAPDLSPSARDAAFDSRPDDDTDPGGIGILSFAVRFPGASTVEALWANFAAGRETIVRLSDDELRAAGVSEAEIADPSYVKARGMIDGADRFDAALFGFTPREAELLDPQHRLLLEVAWEAFDAAGIEPGRFDSQGQRIGVFVGSGVDGYLISNILPNAEALAAGGILQAMILNDRDFLASRLAYELNLKGPAVVVQSACSTALLGVHLACQSLLAGECDVAIAGGSSIAVPLVGGYRYAPGDILSPDGHCRSFDARAEGTVPSSGVGVAVLERADRARAAGRPLRAVIRGTATNNDGSSRVGFTAPSVEGQAQAIAEALGLAEVSARDVAFVEAHGSATPIGDPIEIAALSRAFRADSDDPQWCAVGSAKSNFGHANTAAGIAGLARATLAIEHATIPPTLHFERPNPQIDLSTSPFYVPTRATPWPAHPAGPAPRRAGVSSFGLGGTNVHAVLEQAPEPLPAESSPRPLQPLFLSANSPQALDAMTERLADYLAAHPETDLADVAWTLAVGRRALKFRRAVVASDAAAAAAALRERGRWLDGAIDEGRGTDSDGGRPVAFLFPGLGDQYPGFARGLYDAEPAFREEFDRVATALGAHLGFDLSEILFGGAAPSVSSTGLDLRAMLRRGGAEPAGDLAPTERAQPALFAIEVALARLFERWGVKASALVGYSLGELSAAYVSGALPLADAARLVAIRARWIAELPSGSMLAVPLPAAEVAPYLSETLALAATNGPHLSVLSGPPEAVAEAGRRLAENGIACLPVSTTHAFHSPAMAPLSARLSELVSGLEKTESRIPRLSNVTGSWIGPEDLADPGYWSRHMTGTVRFAESLGELLADPRRILLEVGPGATLGALARQHPAATADLVALGTVRRASESGSDFAPLLAAVARLWTLGAAFDPAALFASERRRIVDLPSYPFERQRFWIEAPKDGALGFARPAATGGIGEKKDLAEWFSLPDLSRTLAPDVPTPADLAAAGPWLVVAGGGFEDLAEPLAQRLEQAGAEVSIVRPEEPLRLEPWVELVGSRVPRRIVVLGGFGAPDVAGELGALCRLTHALGALPVDLLLVGSGLLAVTDEEPRDPELAALAAAFRVVGRELPHGAARALDLPADMSVEASLDALLAEALAPADRGADLIARRGRSRQVRVWRPVRLEHREPPAAFAPGASILITDAANGPGPALAEALALRGARLAVLLPPDFPAEAEWPAVAAGERAEAAAARALLAASRATEIWRGSTDEPERALQLGRARFGRLAGVCHTASGAGGGLAALLEPQALAAALAPDFASARRWADLLAGDREAFLAFFPSNLGATGSFGQLELAAAGAFQACLAEQIAASGRRAFAPLWDPFQWGGWLAAGVGQLTGVASLATPPSESAEAFVRLLAAGVPSLVVSAREFATVLRDDATVDAAALSKLGGIGELGAKPAGERAARRLATPYGAPRSPTETALAVIWSELFGIAEIGRDDDFLALGGHSLLAIQLATAVRTRLDFELPITAIFDAPTVAALGARIDGERLGAEGPTGPPTPPRIVRVTPPDGAGDWPLSFDQERLWFLDQLEPGGTAYNIDLGARMRGVVDLSALYAAAQEIFRRHAAWRTFFPEENGVVVQRVLPWAPVLMPAIDLSALPGPAGEATALRIQLIDSRTPFALDRGPLARLQLLRLAPCDHICLLTVHHTVTDWITFQYFWKELAVIYDAYRRRLPSPLPEPPVQYPDFVLWQRDWLRGEALDRLLAHWRQALDGVPLFVDLPADRPWPPVQSLRGGRHEVRFGSAAPEAWRQLARRAGATSFMVLVAGIAAVLHRFSDQERLIIGTPSANRTQPELEQIFGFFITQLAIPIDLAADPSFVELVARTRRSGTAAFDHQDVPFTRLVDALEPERTTGRAPIIQVAALLLDKSFTTEELPDLKFEAVEVHDGNSRFDLLWGLYEWPDDIRGRLEWNSDVFEAATVARLQRCLEALVAAGIAAPERPLSELELIGPSERHQLLVEGETVPAVAGVERFTLAGLFDAQAARTPEAPALFCGAVRWSYADLDRLSERLAGRLAALGAAPEEKVAIALPRGPLAVAVLLAVAKTGAAYLPLDLSHPVERLSYVLADARAAVLVTADGQAERLGLGGGAAVPGAPRVLDLTKPTDLTDPAAPAAPRVPRRALPESLAYVLYTSGTTGRPKGVGISHRSFATFLSAIAERPGLQAGDALLAVSSFGFDIAGVELFLPLTVGARIDLATEDEKRDGALVFERLVAIAGEQAAGSRLVLQATPGLFRMLIDAGWQGEPRCAAWSAGEALPPGIAAELLARTPEVWNVYGPTETTVFSTFARVGPGLVTIGRPYAGTRIEIVDRGGRLVPWGAVGELWLGGTGVARGYLGRPDLTAERFVPDPFAGRYGAAPGARCYKTGDLARRLPDGEIHCLGRRDFQVKVRGFRIELGEIEAALSRHPRVAEAAVIACADGPEIEGERTRLVAYLVLQPADSADAESTAPTLLELREFLAAALPEPYLPSAFVFLPALPRNANGKVDRAALPAPDPSARGSVLVPLSTPTEVRVAEIWAEVLGIDRTQAPIGADDTFFELGGHSLLATQVAIRLAKRLGKPVPVRAFFQFPTVARLAAALDAAGGGSDGRPPLARVDRHGALPLSFGQERLWFLDRMAPGGAVYNLPLAIRCEGPLDAWAFAAALGQVVGRHEALRTTFDVLTDGRPVQAIAPPGRFSLPSIDLQAVPERGEEEARRVAAFAAVQPFDLARGPLFRAALLRLGPERHLFLLAMHHAVSDAWSMGVLVREATAVYRALVAGRTTWDLPPLPIQYADFAAWQREWLEGAELERQVGHFRSRLAGAPEALDLPTDRPRPALQSLAGAALSLALPEELSAAAFALAQREGATDFMLVFAAWAALLARWAAVRDLVLGTTIANRDAAELEGLIGFFVNTLPLRIDAAGDPTFAQLLARVRAEALDAYAHRDVPFEKLVEELKPARDRSRPPIVQAVLTWQNAAVPEADLGALHLAPQPADSGTSQFDLTVVAGREAGRILGAIEYATALFDEATIRRFAERFAGFLAAAVADRNVRLSALPLLAEPERRALVVERNRTSTPFPRDASIAQLFAEQVSLAPDAIAIEAEEEGDPTAGAIATGATVAISYGELGRRAMKLARQLAGLGLSLEMPIAIVAERAPETLIGILGILAAGGCYVPIDPTYPPERQALLLEDCGAAILLGRSTALDELPSSVASLAAVQMPLDADAEGGFFAALDRRPERPSADSLAYVMYTSGSTGRPKGVWVTHRNVVRLVRDTDYVRFGRGEVFLLFAPIAFDASTLEIWGPLLNGGRLALAPSGPLSPAEIKRALARFQVTTLWLTAGLFHPMADYGFAGLPALSQLLAGGDALSPGPVRQAVADLAPGRLIDGYGPTEGTTFTCCFSVGDPAEVPDPMPIGRPIANARVYVLDADLEPVVAGAWGELYAGGEGIARGYLRRPDLTAERFVPDPFAGSDEVPERSGGRLYRTGDVVRWNPQGVLEFSGRRDGQVKIRGFRIELGEVESALLADARVREAVAIVREDRPGDRRLVAYVALRDDALNLDKLRHLGVSGRAGQADDEIARDVLVRLAARLPEPFVPGAIMVLDALPLTANGKLDRRALPAPDLAVGNVHVEPASELEAQIAAVAAEVLGLHQVGMRDNFFDLGGHSLLATRFVAELEARAAVAVPLQEVFDARDLGDLADRIVERELLAIDDEMFSELLAEEVR